MFPGYLGTTKKWDEIEIELEAQQREWRVLGVSWFFSLALPPPNSSSLLPPPPPMRLTTLVQSASIHWSHWTRGNFPVWFLFLMQRKEVEEQTELYRVTAVRISRFKSNTMMIPSATFPVFNWVAGREKKSDLETGMRTGMSEEFSVIRFYLWNSKVWYRSTLFIFSLCFLSLSFCFLSFSFSLKNILTLYNENIGGKKKTVRF